MTWWIRRRATPWRRRSPIAPSRWSGTKTISCRSRSPATTAFFILAEGRASVEGLAFAAEIGKRSAGRRRHDCGSIDVGSGSGCGGAAWRRRAASTWWRRSLRWRRIAGAWCWAAVFRQLLQRLMATKKPVALVALGNPYLLRNFPDVAAYMTTYSTVPPSEISAVKALFGEIAIGGKLPVSIPGFAQYGDGIGLAPVHAALP